MKKKIYTIATILTLALSLCACSKEEQAETTQATTEVEITLPDLYGEWTDKSTGDTLSISASECILEQPDGSYETALFTDIEGNIFSFNSTNYVISVDNNIITLTSDKNTFIQNSNIQYEEFSIGDTASTDVVDFTLKNYSYVDKLDASSLTPISSGSGLGASEGMTMFSVEYEITNNGKTELNTTTDVIISVDYNNGFIYSMNDDNTCYIVDEPYVFFKLISDGAGQGASLRVPSLTSKDYTTYIPCSDKLKTDSQSPLVINVQLPTSTGFTTVKYIIR